MKTQYISKQIKRVLLCVAVLGIFGCADTKFESYEGNNNIVDGQGGTKSVVDGMDVWSSGQPPRKYKILGIINDSRPSGPITLAQLDGDMVKKAREVGGDALIRLGSNSEITGYVSNGFGNASSYGNHASAFGSSVSTPMSKHYAQFAVVKYLD